jgi:hypothetical protein
MKRGTSSSRSVIAKESAEGPPPADGNLNTRRGRGRSRRFRFFSEKKHVGCDISRYGSVMAGEPCGTAILAVRRTGFQPVSTSKTAQNRPLTFFLKKPWTQGLRCDILPFNHHCRSFFADSYSLRIGSVRYPGGWRLELCFAREFQTCCGESLRSWLLKLTVFGSDFSVTTVLTTR